MFQGVKKLNRPLAPFMEQRQICVQNKVLKNIT